MLRLPALAALAAALIAGLALPTAAWAREPRPRPDWKAIATRPDQYRLHLWRVAWLDGLNQARTQGYADRIAAVAPLLDPAATIATVALPDGAYRCRTYHLGAQIAGVAPFATGAEQPCTIAAGRFTTSGGMERIAGDLWDDDPAHLTFLGTMAIGDETRAPVYGRDAERDMIGLIERIGDRRWRLVLPRPRWQSQIDIVELVPAD